MFRLTVVRFPDELPHHLSAAGLRGPLVKRPDGWALWSLQRPEPPPASYRDLVKSLRVAIGGFAGSVSRLRSLLTVDLSDPDERLAVRLACRTVKLKARQPP